MEYARVAARAVGSETMVVRGLAASMASAKGVAAMRAARGVAVRAEL